MREADVKKIMALRKAGWTTDKIAVDMHLEKGIVDKAIADYQEEKSKKSGTDQEDKPQEPVKEVSFISITSDQLKDIYEKAAAIGAKEALKAFEQERKKEYGIRADRRLRNTKLLLRNYHMLKKHAENSVFGRTQMEESALEIMESMMTMYDNEVIIESIKRSATRTAVIVSHIETMFGLYAAYCDNSPNREVEARRYEVIWDMYMAEVTLTAKEIAEKHSISKDTVYSDMRMAINRLTALIFGVDGLNVQQIPRIKKVS